MRPEKPLEISLKFLPKDSGFLPTKENIIRPPVSYVLRINIPMVLSKTRTLYP